MLARLGFGPDLIDHLDREAVRIGSSARLRAEYLEAAEPRGYRNAAAIRPENSGFRRADQALLRNVLDRLSKIDLHCFGWNMITSGTQDGASVINFSSFC